MKKLLAKIIGATTALAMAICVGVGVAFNREATRLDASEVTWNASAQGYTNAQPLSSASIDSTASISFTDGGTATAYYDTGNAVRIYNGGTFTVSVSSGSMSSIVLTYELNGSATISCSDSTNWNGTTKTWSGSNTSITWTAGTAKHIRLSSVTVTYSSGGGNIDPTGISLNQTNLALFVGGHKQLTATLSPDGASGTVSWISSANDVASVSNGTVTAAAAGNATITAFIDANENGQVDNSELSATCSVTVAQGSLADFNSAVKGDGVDFYAYYVGKYNNASKGYFVSDGETGAYIYDPAPAGVEENDILHITGEVDVYNGLREIKNTSANKVDSHAGLVSPVTLELDESALSSFSTADQGRKATISGRVTTITGEPDYGTNTLYYTITVGSKTIQVQLHKEWITEAEYDDFVSKALQNTNITIEAFVGAYKSGTTDLTQLTSSNYQLLNPKVTAVQEEALSGVELNKDEVLLIVGDSETLTLSPVPGNAELGQITWVSSDEDVATVADGEITAVAQGSTTITATAGGFSDTCEVTVVDAETIEFTHTDLIAGGITGTAGQQTFTGNGLQIEISNGLASDNVRIYKNATITISASAIYSIQFECTASGTSQYGPGCFAEQSGYSYNGAIGTWTGNSASVVLTASSNQVRFTRITIIYSPDDNYIFYDVAFNSLGGGNFDTETVTKGSCIDPLPLPTKAKDTVNHKKFTFDGWFTSNSPFEEVNRFTETTPVNSDLTLYAKYNETNYYIVSFDSNGGTDIDSQEIDSGDTVSIPADPIKPADANYSYEFEYWYTDPELTNDFDFDTPINSNLTLYAKYTQEAINSPQSYLNSASSTATLHARENSSTNTISKTIAEVSGTTTNGTKVADLVLNSDISVSVNPDGTNGNVYSAGAEWRLYQTSNAQVTITASGNYRITSVTFTYTVSNTGILKYGDTTLSSGTPVAIASLASAVFYVDNSGSATNGQVKVTAISVTYVEPLTVDNAAIRFGASIPKSNWDAINNHDGWTITNYGVMLMAQSALDATAYNSVKNAYLGESVKQTPELIGDELRILSKGSGAAPCLDGDNYIFTVKVNVLNSANYHDYICAVPFIVVNGTDYYFLTERSESVQSLATYYSTHDGCTLSADALTILKN